MRGIRTRRASCCVKRASAFASMSRKGGIAARSGRSPHGGGRHPSLRHPIPLPGRLFVSGTAHNQTISLSCGGQQGHATFISSCWWLKGTHQENCVSFFGPISPYGAYPETNSQFVPALLVAGVSPCGNRHPKIVQNNCLVLRSGSRIRRTCGGKDIVARAIAANAPSGRAKSV